MAIINFEIPSTQRHLDCPLVAVAASTSGGSYLMFNIASPSTSAIALWVPEVTCTLYSVSASFINSVSSSNTVYFCMYRSGSQYGATPATAMSSTRQNVYSTPSSYTSISPGDQIEIACFPSGAPGGTLSAVVSLHVVY